MEELVSNGHIVDLIIAVIMIESLILSFYFRATGNGVPIAGVVFNAAAGGALLLALRSALTGAPWWTIAGWLAASLLAHLADLKFRWQRATA